jgi:hypothetical protein
VLKLDAIPAVYTAGFRADPLAAGVDVWGFAFQFGEYIESGAGQNGFGPSQPLVQECARDLLADADAVMKAIAIRPEQFDQARARVEGWARTHPVEYAFSARASGVALVADLRSDDRDVFQEVGTVSDMIENLSERMNTGAAQLPKQARWHAELLLTETAGVRKLDGAEISTTSEQPLGAQPISWATHPPCSARNGTSSSAPGGTSWRPSAAPYSRTSTASACRRWST